jgi:hypothetical protein
MLAYVTCVIYVIYWENVMGLTLSVRRSLVLRLLFAYDVASGAAASTLLKVAINCIEEYLKIER